MSLTYRGVTYEPTPSNLPTPSPTVMGRYRGVPVVIQLPMAVPHPVPTHTLTYRGIRYGASVPPIGPLAPTLA